MSAPAIRMNRLNADLILLAAAAIWGLAFLFQKSAMAHVGPLTFIAARGALAALALAPLAWREHARAARDHAGAGFCRSPCGGGLLFFVAAWLQQAGIRTATVTNTGFLTALYVVITPFIAWGWSGKRPNAAGVARGCPVRVRHLAARRRHAQRLLAGRHAGGAVGGVLGRPCGHHRTAPRTSAGPSASRPSSSPSWRCWRSPACVPLETVTLAGLAGRGRRHRLRRAAVERAHLHAADRGAAAHAAVGGRRHRQPGDGVCGARRLPLLGERLGAIGWVGAALILAAILFVQLAAAIGARWRWN